MTRTKEKYTMLHIRKFIIAGCVVTSLTFASQAQETPMGPLVRWGSELAKTEPVSNDALKKMSVDLNDLKARLQLLEETQTRFHSNSKTQTQSIMDTLKGMQQYCDRLQTDLMAVKTAAVVTQAGAIVPVNRKPIEDGVANKPDVAAQEVVSKKFDELAIARQEISKLGQEVQSNTREITDLKKKYEAMQIDFIQAQNDIGKLQQDMVKLNARLEGDRTQASNNSNDRTRQSFALPTPPETQGNLAPRPNLGVLKLVNNYPLTVTAIVDGQYYTLLPNQSVTLNRAPGYVTYEVVGIQGNTLRTINAAETLTVQIVPR
jgi:predicted  nucleic acid-binding Zn-ribbon protein